MFWDHLIEMASLLDADRQCVGQVVDETMRYLSGREAAGLFLVGMEKALEAAKEDEAVIALLDEWLTGVCLHQLGLFSVWGRKGRWQQAYICWSNAAAKLAKMTGGTAPQVGMREMLAEWKLQGCVLQKRSMHILLALATNCPALQQLRRTLQAEARWVTSMRYPVFGVAKGTIEASFGLFTVLAFLLSYVLLHRALITFPMLALTMDVSRDRMKEFLLIAYEGVSFFHHGLQIFGSRLLFWLNLGVWVLILEWVPAWWIRRLLR